MGKKSKLDGVMVHQTAIVDSGAQIGQGTYIWHWTHVSGRVRIGSDCTFGQNVFVANNVQIGDKVKVQNNVSIYEGVRLDSGVFCGPSVVFTNVKNPRSNVDRRGDFQATWIKRGASLGANSTIVCGVTIGQYAFVAAGAVVTNDVPDFGLVAGVPARHVGWMSRNGERLELPLTGDGVASCKETRENYHLRDGICVSERDE